MFWFNISKEKIYTPKLITFNERLNIQHFYLVYNDFKTLIIFSMNV